MGKLGDVGLVGYVGLGIMGLPMAKNLARKSGISVVGYDVSKERCGLFREYGAIADNPEEIYGGCDVVFFCLPTNELLEGCVEALISVAPKGTTVVDMGSTSPEVIRSLSPAAQEKGISLIDSPVSGGEPKAIDGTLALMCGGNEEAFRRVAPLLAMMGSTVTYMGGSGNGSVAKLANNMIVGCNIAAVGEAFCFALKAGLNIETLFEAIRRGFAGSAVLESKAPLVIQGAFTPPSARVSVHQKDLKNAVALAEKMGVEIPLSHKVLDYMNELETQGLAGEDHGAVARIYEQTMGVKLGKS
ncbi:MAG: prephenate dehydrogenase/arogenate dehydrogenase family protein [Synergistaceae bacterium]|jgi:2-hydroxy-3-oxopropionate reductase|nr:prephenate dehydrogenase/arogenate dehydrogenase family protein [Synergistaceae bacterium]